VCQLLSPKRASSKARTLCSASRELGRRAPLPSGEVFESLLLSWGSAFSCRGRPVLSFALRRLKSCPTPSGLAYSMPQSPSRTRGLGRMCSDPTLLHDLLKLSPRFLGGNELLTPPFSATRLTRATHPLRRLRRRYSTTSGTDADCSPTLRQPRPDCGICPTSRASEHPHPLEQVRVAMALFQLV
jgi:hypothetical protein